MASRWKSDTYPGGAWFICDRCSQRWRRSQMITEWTGLKVCAPCLDPLPPQILPPEVYPEGIPFMDARPPQDNSDRLQDDTYLQAVVGGLADTNGTYPIYPNHQQTPIGGLSPQHIIVDPIPKDTPQRDLVADLVTLRTGQVFGPTATQLAAPSDPNATPVTAVTPPNPSPPPPGPPPLIPPPLTVSVSPDAQSTSRSGPGQISATLTVTAGGGVPPYAYATSAPGLTVTGGNTANPTVSTALTSGQDSTFTITVTLTDSTGTVAATGTTQIEFVANAPPPLQLVVSPVTQAISRSGAGAVSAGVTYTASGGIPPYAYSTVATGLSIAGGTTTNPTVSTTLTAGQDTTYTVTGTVTDSVGTTPASASASVEFASVPLPLVLTATPSTQRITRADAGAISTTLTYVASGGVTPYTYATSAPGLTVTNGTTTTPTLSGTLTAGQDTVYPVTGTVTDSLAATAGVSASVEFKSIVSPLVLVATPATQKITRSGAGSISTGVTYTASGGSGVYTYATSAPGLSVSGGTTTTPTLSTTLLSGQDTAFNVTGTLTDSLGTTPATANAAIEFVATVPPVGLSLKTTPATQQVSRSGAGSVSTTFTYAASGGTPPYTYATAAPGLSISGGTTTTPTVSTTLTNGQDTTFSVTGTVTDSLSATATSPSTVEFVSIPPALVLTTTPATQRISRSGGGAISATLTYTATGGVPPYVYSTSAPGLAITGGTTTTPTVSTTVTSGQDTTYPITGTVRDSIGNQVTSSASVEFVAVPLPLSIVAAPSTQHITRSGAGAVSASLTYAVSGGVPPYGFTTTAPGLTIANGASNAPTVSTTLTNGQDTTFTITGTVNDNFGTTPASASVSVEFQSIVPPLSLTVLPATQLVTRVGPGDVLTGLAYTASGGQPPYTYATSAPGLTVTIGNTAAPNVSTTLTALQDTTYTVTGTLSDSLGTTPATASATVEFKALPLPVPPPFDPMKALAYGFNADQIGINKMTPGAWANSPYAASDMKVFQSLGVTYFRIPMDISYIMPGLPITHGGGALSTPATCATVLAHIDSVMSLMASFGFVMVPVLFVDQDLRVARGNAGTFNSMMTAAMTFMANRWMNPASPTYYDPTRLILNIYNEPRFSPNQGFAYTLWSDPLDNTAGLMPLMIAAVRAVSTAHTLLIDTVGQAKPESLAFQGISPDSNVIYSAHIYNPANLTQIGTPGFPLDQWFLYPGRGEVIGPPPPSNFLVAPTAYHLAPLNWKTGTVLTGQHQKQKYTADKLGNPQYGSLPGVTPVIKPITEDYWNSEITAATLHNYVQSVRTWATAHSVRVIIGEFGVTNNAPYAGRLQWVQDVVAACQAYSLPRAWWSVDSNTFGIRPNGDLTGSNAVIDLNPASPTFKYDLDLLRLLKFTG